MARARQQAEESRVRRRLFMHRLIKTASLLSTVVVLIASNKVAANQNESPGANSSAQISTPQEQSMNCVQTGMRCVFRSQRICCHGYCDQLTQRCKNNGGVGNCIQTGMQCNPLNQMRRCCYGYCDQLTQECRNYEGGDACLTNGQPCIRNGASHCCSNYCSPSGYCQIQDSEKDAVASSTGSENR